MDHPSAPATYNVGYWEIAVPNGQYQVTVAVGDPTSGQDPEVHRINAEGVNLVNNFVPSGAVGSNTRHTTGSGVVTVVDGNLTLDYSGGGVNTKLDYVIISDTSGSGNDPFVTGSVPANNATNVNPCTVYLDIAATVFIPVAGEGVDGATLTPQTVRLYRTSDQAEVPASRGTTGGGDAIVLNPSVDLDANTQYTFEITSGVHDVGGRSFLPYIITFTTGSQSCVITSTVEFEQVNLNITGGGYSSLLIGPDDKLYGTVNNGYIRRWTINSDGTLSNEQTISSLRTAEGGDRLLIGAHFDPASTTGNLILWVSHTTYGFNNMPDWGGKITRLSGPNLETVQDYVINLPRSIRDHVTNSVEFGPDGMMYFLQGSTSAMGAPDSAWGNRSEHALSAAVLRLDASAITSPPLNAQTESPGTYDPFAPGAPLTVFGSGVRNAYDLVWHSNGNLYVPTNGSAAGGNSPGTPTTLPAVCQTRVDDAINGDYTGPQVPAANNNGTQPDLLFRLEATGGGYYGHPNPARCEWVLNGGNPTSGNDPIQVTTYPVGTQPDRNWRGIAYNFENNKSPNGVIEYQSNVFNGALQDKLMVVRYSGGDDIIVLTPNGTNGDIASAEVGIPGLTGFSDPLDVTEGPNGVLYVSEYAQNTITLVRPLTIPGGAPEIGVNVSRLIFDQITSAAASATKAITITNTGTDDLEISDLLLTGVDGSQFQIVSPPSLPLVIVPSGVAMVNIAFDPTSNGPKAGVLEIVSNDADEQIVDVTLRGLGENGSGGSNEPSLQWILDTWQIAVDAGDTNPSTNVIDLPGAATYNSLIGDEVAAQAFQKAGTGSVTLELLSVYGPESNNPVTTVGWYPASNPSTTNALFSIANAPGGNGQTLTPATTGAFSFDPGSATFGFYSQWPAFANHLATQQDSLNTWETNANQIHKVRVYPITGQPNAYIVATEETTSGNDYQDVVYIVRNVQPAALVVPSSGEIDLKNRDWVFPVGGTTDLPAVAREHFDGWLSMSRTGSAGVGTSPQANNGFFNDTATLGIVNTSTTESLTITNLSITGTDAANFILVTPPTLPAVISANGELTLQVRFIATSNRKIHRAQLTITSSDGDEATSVVQLAGWWQSVSEGGQEPDVAQISQLFGFATTIVSSGQQINNQGRIEAVGEEILSPFWHRANTGQPIYIRQLAAFHSCCSNTATVIQHTNPPGGGSTSNIFTHNGSWAQTILPRINGSSGNPAQGSYNPPNALFGFKIDSEWSDDSRNNANPDICLTNSDPLDDGDCGHHVRFWPVRASDGTLVPNTYLMVMDYSGINYDFNDNVYLITNIEPENAPFDLAVTQTGESADPVAIGTSVTYTFEVNNPSAYNSDPTTFSANVTGPGTLANLYLGTTPPDTGTSTPTVVARYNAGGPTVTATDSGPNWLADTSVATGAGATNSLPGDPYNNTDPLAGPEVLYDTERSGNSPTASFGYAIPLTNGDYEVHLHFAEIWFTGQAGRGSLGGNRLFNVTIEGTTVLTNYDPKTAAGAPLQTVVESFLTTVSDGVLNIEFIDTATDRPTIAAIEVIGNVSATNPCSAGSCPISALEVGASQIVTAVVDTTGTGTVNITGALAGGDSNTANDSDDESTQVFDPLALPGTITIVKQATPESSTVFPFTATPAIGATTNFELTDSGTGTSGSSLNFNFQTENSATPAGYLADSGQAFGPQPTGYTHGWLNAGTNLPIDASGTPGASPAFNDGAMRDRDTAGVAQELDTVVHLQRGDISTTGWLTPIYWEIELPNGDYEVTVGLGDTPAIDSTYQARVEGVSVLATPFVPTAGNGFTQGTVTVTVTDGRLTLDAVGGSNTKATFIQITPLAPDNEITFTNVSPGSYTVDEVVPTDWSLASVVCVESDTDDTTTTATGAVIALNPGEDVVCTFNNEAVNAAPVADDDSAVVSTGGTVVVDVLDGDSDSDGTVDTTSVIVETPVTHGTTDVNPTTGAVTYTHDGSVSTTDSFTYTVADNLGERSNAAVVNITINESGSITIVKDAQPDGAQSFGFVSDVPSGATFSLTDSGATSGTPININFQNAAGNLPAGYIRDFGQAYGLRTDANQGSGLSYGWVVPGTNTPLDLSVGGSTPGNGRDRNVPSLDQRIDTLMHMQGDDVAAALGSFNGTAQPGAWEIELPNGSYEVTVGVGDPSLDTAGSEPIHRINVEGVNAINNFVPTGAANALTRFTSATVIVSVTDGRLTVDATGGGFNTKITYVDITPMVAQNTITFSDVVAGSYTVTEDAVSGWNLTGVICTGDSDNGSQSITGGITIDLDGGENITCTFTNQSSTGNVAPVADDDSAAVNTGGTVVVDVLDGDTDLDGTIDPTSVIVETSAAHGTTDVNPTTGAVTYIHNGDSATTDSFTYTVADNLGARSNEATVNITITPAAADCSPISTLPCTSVPVSVPFVLDWNLDEGGLNDGVGAGTGFRMVDPPSARLAVDGTPFDTAVPGYEPALLNVNTTSGTLTITSTKGIQYRDPSVSSNTNSQINALGAGFSVDAAHNTIIETVLANPNLDAAGGASNQAQQAGVWFGLNENNYAKVVIARSSTTANAARVQVLVESYGASSTGSLPVEINTANNTITNVSSQMITLRMVINPTANTVTGFYKLGTGSFVQIVQFDNASITSLALPAAFVAGVDHDANGGTAPVSYAGVFTTHRNAAATPPMNIAFDRFSIAIDDTTPPVITLLGDAIVNLNLNDPYSDAGATALDNVDGDISANIVVGGDVVNTTIAGTYVITYNVSDAAGNAATEVTRTVNVGVEPPVDCSPISTLNCAQVPVSVPYVLDWSADAGGLGDNSSIGTGFTMVDPPSARLAVDGTPSVPSVPGYEPSKLTVNTTTGTLTIASTQGIQFSTGTPSAAGNSQINGLGVGIDASASPLVIQTTLTNLPSPSTQQFQQAGLWFGLNEATHIKLVVYNNSGTGAGYEVQFAEETNDIQATTGPNNTIVNDVVAQGGSIILRMELDPVVGTLVGSYSLDGGANFVTISTATVNAALFAGVDHDANGATDAISYAGIVATNRRSTESLNWTFDQFSITPPPSALADATVTFTIMGGHQTHTMPMEVIMVDPNTNTVVFQQTIASTGNSTNGEITVTGVVPGTYDLYLKGPNALREVTPGVTLVAGTNTVGTTPMRSGDGNNDNLVSLVDFSILSVSFNKADGDAGYDARADFNGDSLVSLVDFSRISVNFNVQGAQLPTP